MAAEKAIICVLFEEFSEPDEIGINTCLILQNKREHPNRVKGFVETVVPNYCDPTFASIIHFLPQRLCYDLYDIIIFIVSIRLIVIADHCCCSMIL